MPGVALVGYVAIDLGGEICGFVTDGGLDRLCIETSIRCGPSKVITLVPGIDLAGPDCV